MSDNGNTARITAASGEGEADTCGPLRSAWAVQRVSRGGVCGGVGGWGGALPLSWKLDHRLAIVSRSAKFIINSARGAALSNAARAAGARGRSEEPERKATSEEQQG